MDVVFATNNFGMDPTIGFMPLMAVEMQQRGHNVRGVQCQEKETLDRFPIKILPTPDVSTPWWIRSWIFYKSWRRHVREYLEMDPPDVVIASTRTIIPTLQAATSLDIPTVGVYVGLGSFRFNQNNLDLDKSPVFRNLPVTAKIQYPFVRSIFSQHESAVSEFDRRIVVSSFLKDVLFETFDVDAEVVRTPIPLDDVTAPSKTPKFITMINPRTRLKGSHILVRLARHLDEQEFLVAGTFADRATRQKVESLPNVELTGWVDDMREIYAQTKLLVIPSLVEEGGPRIIGEAFANGIPVVGTTRGGIPEFVGDAGETVTDPYDISEWEEMIELVHTDYDAYEQRASERASVFALSKLYSRFTDIVSTAAKKKH